jgi:hypothetical protein
MEQKENIQEEQNSKTGNFWTWSIPVAILVYFISSGPMGFIFIKMEKLTGSDCFEKIYMIIYFPIGIIIENQIPILYNIFYAYMKFWFELAGMPV